MKDNATIAVICSGGISVDLYGTNNDDADATALTGWVPLSTTTTITDTTGGWAIEASQPWDRLLIEYTASDATNAINVSYTVGA